MLDVAVLASGAGSNLSALLDTCASGRIAARVSIVLCNVPGAGALEKARQANVPAVLVDHRGFEDRASFEAALQEELERRQVGLIVLAGFMRLLSAEFIHRWEGRIINVHPSLLPAFPGLAAPKQALEAGVRIAGCTVHIVDAGTDTGPIVTQAAVPVLQDDTVETLHQRIQLHEHRLLPWVVGLFAEGRVKLSRRSVTLDLAEGAWRPEQLVTNPSPEDR